MNIQTILNFSTQSLAKISSSPTLDAELLLVKILNVSPTHLHAYPEQKLTPEQQHSFNQLLQRRLAGEPVAYILESQSFWDIDLKITADVLIPRPETELLIEIILKKFSAEEELHIADLGTGSGAIALALAKTRSQWHLTAVDISAAALSIAEENARRLRLNNICFYQSNWLAALATKKFSVIVSNPPYLAENDPHLAALSHEPKTALISGDDGLDEIRKIILEACHHLLPDGLLLLEHGYEQAAIIRDLLQQAGYGDIKTYRDYAGHERVCLASYNFAKP